MTLSLADFTLILSSLVLMIASTLVVLRFSRQEPGGKDRGGLLSDGAVLIASEGRITRLAEGARRLLGDVGGQPLTAALRRYLGATSDEVLEEVQRLLASGEPLRLLTSDCAGRAIELSGAPEGGQVRLVIRDASLLESRLGAAEARLAEREKDLERETRANATLAGLVEGAPLIVWSRDRNGLIRWSGGRIESEGHAVDPAEIISLLPPASDRLLKEMGEPDRVRLEVPVGGDATVAIHAIEIAAPEGGRLGFAVDASMAASAERTLTRFVQTMTETFAHLTVGLAIFDRNKTLALFNPALVQMWGLDASWLARRPSLLEIIEALRSARRIPDVENFHQWRGRLLALFEDTEQADYEEVWHLGDGSNVRVLARPHPHGALAFVFDDVTERLRLEQQFRHSIDLRRATLDRMDEGLAVFRPDGILQFVNAAFHRMWGTDAEALGPAPHARVVAEICGTATVEADVWNRVTDFVIADPTRRPWRTRVTLGSGRVLSVRVAALPDGSSMVLFTDITDSERIAAALSERNEALETASEMRSAVLDQISHRLRTPLNTIFGFAQLIADPRFGELTERQRDYASGILEAAGNLLDTIDDVTELAGLEIDPLHDEGTPHLVWEIIELSAGLLHKRAISVGADLVAGRPGDEDAHLSCDLPQLRQIVFALGAEALQRASPGRRIELQACAAEDGTTLEIRTREEGGAGLPARPDLNGNARSFLARMAARAGGSYALETAADGSVIGAVCRLPDALDAEAEAESDTEPAPAAAELIDELPVSRER